MQNSQAQTDSGKDKGVICASVEEVIEDGDRVRACA